MKNQSAVFLDRDGVVNDNTRPVNHPDDLILYPFAGSAIRLLKESGFKVFIVTNQGGIELGFMSHLDLDGIHHHLQNLLSKDSAEVDEIIYCPHYRKACECRKPKPGMLLNLIKKYHLEPQDCWMIGDRDTDSQAGKTAGCRTIKLGDPDPYSDYTCNTLREAVQIICQSLILNRVGGR